MKKQSTKNNYRTFKRNVQLLISEEFAEREIPANDSVRLLEEIVEEMDLSSLYGAYKRRGRKAANNPARITSEQGILRRMNHSIQSEGAFGAVKQNYGFRQFLLRGNKKVKTEILLIAMAYNINKYHAKIQQNRTGKQLFKKLSA